MALRHAVLASLLDGPASGYELAKRMDVSVANFWQALPTQIYSELRRLEEDRLVETEEVVQSGRPNKRLFEINAAGLEELHRFIAESPRRTSIKDDLLVQIQAADIGDREVVAEAIDERREDTEIRLDVFERLIRQFLRGRTEEEFLQRARRIGPYLNLRRGRDFERENIAWYRWAAEALRRRGGGE